MGARLMRPAMRSPRARRARGEEEEASGSARAGREPGVEGRADPAAPEEDMAAGVGPLWCVWVGQVRERARLGRGGRGEGDGRTHTRGEGGHRGGGWTRVCRRGVCARTRGKKNRRADRVLQNRGVFCDFWGRGSTTTRPARVYIACACMCVQRDSSHRRARGAPPRATPSSHKRTSAGAVKLYRDHSQITGLHRASYSACAVQQQIFICAAKKQAKVSAPVF